MARSVATRTDVLRTAPRARVAYYRHAAPNHGSVSSHAANLHLRSKLTLYPNMTATLKTENDLSKSSLN
ncbi:major histocompatibility complex, class II, DR beta 1 precursor [Corchorus olitorius]|uniref:Major histocompatibility complex, class II, DR beta 1 n=1 Tax=Corchorus olitorius TaxID=93759 RepID=A0A1R3GXN2_9ROSI|nr:major histocompatibility complex, class II, DR beta 1 precursor [Corchorus olitorius]